MRTISVIAAAFDPTPTRTAFFFLFSFHFPNSSFFWKSNKVEFWREPWSTWAEPTRYGPILVGRTEHNISPFRPNRTATTSDPLSSLRLSGGGGGGEASPTKTLASLPPHLAPVYEAMVSSNHSDLPVPIFSRSI